MKSSDWPRPCTTRTRSALQLDGPIFDRPPFQFEDHFGPGDPFVPFFKLATCSFGRWTVDLPTGRLTTERLDDQPCELPKVDERHYGRPYRWGFLIAGENTGTAGDPSFRLDSLARRDVRTGAEERFRIATDAHSGVFEATFAPRSPEAPEGDGFLIVPVCHFAAGPAHAL